MDVHNDTMAVADIATDHDAEVVSLGPLGTRHSDLDQRLRTMPSTANQLLGVDEAGPWGAWRARDLRTQGDEGWVVAPARMPQQAGDRVQPARRDAGHLARLLRAGDLTPVAVPTADDAAMRERTRAREAARRDLQAATLRLTAVWLRHASRSTGPAQGGPAHRRWRAAVVWHTPAPQLVFQEDVRAVHEHTERLERRAPARHDQAQAWRVSPVVDALQARRGVPCTVAVTTGAALGDRPRVEHPRPRMPCVGRIPAADSRGARRRPGARTNAGHTQARRARVDGAWAARDPAHGRRPLQRRLAPPPKAIPDLRGKAHVRRCNRVRRRMARGNQATPVVVAMARELGGCLGAMATQVPVTRSGPQTERPGMNRGKVRPSRALERCREDTRQGVGVSQ